MSDVPVVVPEGKDLTDLTIGELDKVSRELKHDVLDAVAGGSNGAYRWGAMARLAWLWARRTDPQAKLQTFLDYETEDLTHACGWDRNEPGELLDPTAGSDETSLSDEPDSPVHGADSHTSSTT